MYKKLAGQVGLISGIRISIMVVQFFYFIIVTRMLSESEYGILSLFIAILTLLSTFFNFGLGEFIIKELSGSSRKEEKIRKLFPFPHLIALVFIMFLAVFNRPFLALFGLADYKYAFFLILAAIFLRLLFIPMGSVFRSEKRSVIAYSITFIFNSSWMVLVILYALIAGKLSIQTVFLAHIIGFAAGFAVIFSVFYRSFGYFPLFSTRLDMKYIIKAFRFSLPLLVLAISQYVITTSDRFFIKYFHTAEVLGYYSYIYSLIGIILPLITTIFYVNYPHIVEYYNHRKMSSFNFMTNMTIKYCLIFLLPAVFGFLAMGREIITMLSGSKYLPGLPILPILFLFPVFQILTTINMKVHILENKTNKIALINIIGMSLNIMLNMLLIPKYSMVGAAVATIITYAYIYVHFQLSSTFVWDMGTVRPARIFISSILMAAIIYPLEPMSIFWKAASICLGALLYFGFLFILGVFSAQERRFIASLSLDRLLKK